MNFARYAHTSTLLPSGNVLVVGGDNRSGILSSVELYNPATNTCGLAPVWWLSRTLCDA